MKKGKIVAVIQARMGSTRLAGKVMKEIMNKPMIQHIYNRLNEVKTVDEVVIATTLDTRDKVIVEFAKKNGIKCYAGSEKDLVDRMYQTADRFEATAIIRVTADCPLVDPVIVESVASTLLDYDYDYVSTWTPQSRSYPHGLDVDGYSMKCLKRLWHEVKDPLLREWIPFNIHEHPHEFHVKVLPNDEDLSGLRLTVDYEEDLILIHKIYDSLYREDRIFCMDEIIEFLKMNPELAKINEKYKDKKGIEGYIKGKDEQHF